MRIASLCVLVALAGHPYANSYADFVPGDCVHVTVAAGTNTAIEPAVLLIKTSPISVTPLFVGNGLTGDGAYDSFRRAPLVIRATASGRRISAISSTGIMTDVPYAGAANATLVAPTGDGRVYIQRPGTISYIDGTGVTHDLLAVSGSAAFVPARAYRRMYFDAASNSIFFGDTSGGTGLIVKYPLSADGSRLASTPSETLLTTPGLAGVVVVGISPGPSGSLFIKLDDNGGGSGPRMLLFNPITLSSSVYATSNYFGVGGEIAGCYTQALNAALVLDSLSDQLRRFSFGTVGEGVVLPGTSALSSGGSGENATMFPITPATSSDCPGDFNNDAMVDDADFSIFAIGYNILDCADPTMPAGCPADLNNDAVVDDADFSIFIAAYDVLLCP